MKVNSLIYRLYLLFTLILSLNCLLEEGNILLPMSSNFTLEHYQNKVYNKNYYTIPLLIGTPEEEYEVQVDTSTATTWIPSSRCKNCKLARRLFDPEDSRTSSPTDILIEIEDEDGNVEGYQIADNIKLGSYKLKQFGFVEVTKLSDNFKDHEQGKLGLGYKSHTLVDDEYNFLEKLKRHNLIKKKVFSINSINSKKGMLFIGDVPGKSYNTYCNVTDTEDLDDVYKESWVCKMSHVGMFDREKGIFNKIKFYSELKNNKLVSFDSAYDFIAVPISEKITVEKLLAKAKLECTESKRNKVKSSGKGFLRNRIREEEITISCETNMEELKKKNLAFSFVLQGVSYSLPLENLFEDGVKDGEMDMLIKYIDDENAIWTLGYPFLTQYLMIFDMEDEHVGIKKLKKTALPIVNINEKDMMLYNLGEDSSTSGKVFKVVGYLTLIAVALAILFFVYRAIRKNGFNPKSSSAINEHKVDPIF
jgi:hypothetical protein